ncbi:precorrin-6y C5,15-methyltransferase (decarboxylating) subunit CbiE [Pseudonocardia benzenivorans]
MTPALPGLFDELADRAVCVLASGDPMFFGIGATLARLLSPERLRVLPAPSSVALACARLGWPAEEVDVVSVVGRPLARVRRALAPGRRVIVLSSGAESPGEIAALLDADGWGPARSRCSNSSGPGGAAARRARVGLAAPARRRAQPRRRVLRARPRRTRPR